MDKDLADKLRELQKEDVYVGHDEAGNYYVTKGSDPSIQKAIASGQTSGNISVPATKATGWAARVEDGRGYQIDTASASLDKDTGKITLSAPKMILQNETFQSTIKPVLEAISVNQQLNPNYKYSLINTEEGKENTKTSEDWIKEINETGLPQLSRQAFIMESTKQDIKDQYGVDLNDNQVIKMSQIALSRKGDDGKEYKVNPTDRQSLPKSLFKNLSLFQNIDGYDDETHTISYSNLMEAWNRPKKGDDAIMDTFKAVDDYFDKKNFDDADEFAEMIAFRDFINGQDPSSDFWYGMKDVNDTVLSSIGTGVASTAAGIANATEELLNIAGRGGTMAGLAVSGKEVTKKKAMAGDITFAKDFVDSVDEWKNSIAEDYKKVSDFKSGSFSVGSSIVELAGQIGLSVIAGNVAAGYIGDAAAALASKYGTTATKLKDFAAGATTIAKDTKKVRDLTTDLYKGTELMLVTSNARTANVTISGAIDSVRALNAAKTTVNSAKTASVIGQTIANAGRMSSVADTVALDYIAPMAARGDSIMRVGKGFATAADIAAQTVVDVTLSSPKLLRQFMDGEVTDENKAYMMEQLAWNVGGWAGGAAAIKGIKGFAKSEVGRVLDAAISPKLGWLGARMGETADDLKTLLHHGDSDWLAKKVEEAQAEAIEKGTDTASNKASRLERKLQVQEANRLVRRATLDVSDLHVTEGAESWADLVKNADDIKAKRIESIGTANIIANSIYRQDISSMNARVMSDYSALKATRDSYLDALTKVNRLERASGFKVQKMISREQPVSLSKQVNEYVQSIYRRGQAETTIRLTKDAETLAGAKKELAHLDSVIASYRKTFSPELREAADELERIAREFSDGIQDVKVAEKVMSSEQLNAMRGSGYFDNGYLRQQRLKDWDNYIRNRDNLEVRFSELRGDQHIKWGNTEDEWQDLSVVLFDELNETSRRIYRKQQIEGLRGLGEHVVTRVSGEQTELIKTVTPIRKAVEDNIAVNTKKLVSNADTDAFDKMFDKKNAESLIRTQVGRTVDSSLDVARAKRARKPISDRSMLITIGNPNMVSDDIIEEIVVSKLGKHVSEFTADEFAAFIKDAPDEAKAVLRKNLGVQKTADITFDDFTKTINDRTLFTQSFETDLNRSLVRRNYKDMWDGERGGRAFVDSIKDNKRVFDAQTVYKENLDRLKELKAQYDIPQMSTDIDRSINDFIDDLIDTNSSDEKTVKAMEKLGQSNADELVQYATLKSLKDDLETVTSNFRSKSVEEFNKDLTANNTVVKDGKKVQKLTGSQIDKLANQWADECTDILENAIVIRYGETTAALRATGSDIVDYDEVFGIIDALNKDITGISKNTGTAANIIKTYDSLGREEWVELSPTVAQMITTMPRPLKRGPFGQIRQEFVRVFRALTTGGLIPASLLRQGFRDTGSAVITGGAVMSEAAARRHLEKVFGEYVGDQIYRDMPDLWSSLMRESTETGEDIAETFARREMARGAANVDRQTESQLYRFARNAREEANAYKYTSRFTGEQMVAGGAESNASRWSKLRDRIDRWYYKTEKLNNMRETYLRKRVYDNALAQALEQGMTLNTARKYATFLQAEATTNFGRQIYHFANLSQTVPYLSAAVNGAKSFWRLWAFDPVGVTTRIVGGYVVPMMALLTTSLGDPENRRVYKQIKEYEKDDNLVFVLEGQKISIPMPQEIAAFIRPLQSLIETMYDANDHSFTELMVNDLVGLMPYEWSGFVNIDSDRILINNSGNFFTDIYEGHLAPGFSKWSSQLMDPMVKAAVVGVTGYDPYTGKPVDTSYSITNVETGERQVMDYKVGVVARLLGTVFKDYLSPQRAQSIFNNLLGSSGVEILDGLIGLGTAAVADRDNFAERATELGDTLAGQVTGPFTITHYNEVSNSAWNRATNVLYAKKEALLRDDELRDDIKTLNTKKADLSESARKKIMSRIKTKIEDYQLEVLNAANNLVKNYDGGILDKNKYATVLSLMSFDDDTEVNFSNAYASEISGEQYSLAKAAAVETMQRMGFRGVDDNSMFGYYKRNDNTGAIEFKKNSPLVILNYDLSSKVQDDIAKAEIRNLVNNAGLFNKHESIKTQIDKISNSKKKPSKQDYANMDAIRINWNAEVMKTIAPVVQRMTPEAAINNSEVMNYLYSLIEVPSEWQKDKRGRYVSLGSMGNKKRAYYESWIRSMYGIKDKYKGQY